MTRQSINKIPLTFAFATSLLVAACQSPVSPSSTITPSDAQFAASKTVQATAIAVSAPNGVVGQSVTVTVNLMTAGHPLGGKRVSLTIDGRTPVSGMAQAGGVATFTVTSLSAGSHSAVAQFGGDSNYGPSSASASFDVTAP